jgi:hypothetical protein
MSNNTSVDDMIPLCPRNTTHKQQIDDDKSHLASGICSTEKKEECIFTLAFVEAIKLMT